MIKWIIGASIIFISAALVGGLLTSDDPLTSVVGPKGVFETLITGWKYVSSGNIIQIAIGAVMIPFGFIKAIGGILFWDAEFYHGYWLIIKLMIFWPISLGILVSLILQLRGGSG